MNLELKVLSKAMNLARDWGCDVADTRPCKHCLKVPPAKRTYLRQPEALKLLEVIVPHARPPVLLSLYTGLRRDNALHIIWDQIWLDAERPFAEVLAKGDKRHVVWLPAEAVALLSSIASGPARRRGPVFWFDSPRVACDCIWRTNPEQRDRPIQSIRRSFKTAARQIGLPELRQHDLRHTFASWVPAEGLHTADRAGPSGPR